MIPFEIQRKAGSSRFRGYTASDEEYFENPQRNIKINTPHS